MAGKAHAMAGKELAMAGKFPDCLYFVPNHVDSFRYVLHLPDCLYLVPNHVYSCVQQLRLRYKFPYDCQLFSRHCPCFSRHRPRFFAINLVKQLRLRYDIPCYFPAIAQAFPVMEDGLSIF